MNISLTVRLQHARLFRHDTVTTISTFLQYLKSRGFVKVTKLILAAAGKFPGDYFDDRCVDLAKCGLDQNLGRLPIANVDGRCIGQSTAINYFFASEFGLMGKNNFEAARIVSLSEHLRECYEAYRTLVPQGQEPTAHALDLWFEGGAQDVSGHAVTEDRARRYLTWWMGRIERSLEGRDGFAVGSQLSLADLLLYNSFAETETMKEEHCAEEGGSWRRGPMGDQRRMDAMLTAHPRIKESCRIVARHPNILKLLAMTDEESNNATVTQGTAK